MTPLPCPFCKRDEGVETSVTYPGFWIIACTACYEGEPLGTYRSEHEAIECWNLECEERAS